MNWGRLGRRITSRDGLIAIGLIIAVAVIFGLVVHDQNKHEATANSVRSVPLSEVESSYGLPPAPKILAVLGDSYAEGAGAPTGQGWVTWLIRTDCWVKGAVSAEGGTGYTNAGPTEKGFTAFTDPNRLQAIIDGQPNVVIVQGGINDERAAPSAITAAADTVFTKLRNALPDALIVAVGPTVPPAKTAQAMEAVTAAIAPAAYRHDVKVIDPATKGWLEPTDGLYFTDRVHPDLDGHKELARQLSISLANFGAARSCAS